MTSGLTGKYLVNTEEVKIKVSQRGLGGIPENLVQGGICGLEDRRNRCVNAGGDYFEGFHEE